MYDFIFWTLLLNESCKDKIAFGEKKINKAKNIIGSNWMINIWKIKYNNSVIQDLDMTSVSAEFNFKINCFYDSGWAFIFHRFII